MNAVSHAVATYQYFFFKSGPQTVFPSRLVQNAFFLYDVTGFTQFAIFLDDVTGFTQIGHSIPVATNCSAHSQSH